MDLYQAALAYTARYATSKENLWRVLWRKLRRAAARRGEEIAESAAVDAEITTIIIRLENIGAVNDECYAKAQLRTLKACGTSARAIRAKLTAKGVPAGMIASLPASGSPEEDERAAAARYAQRRRLGPYWDGHSMPEQRRKDLAALCRAGFGFSVALEVIDTHNCISR